MGKVLHGSKSGFFPFCLDFSDPPISGQYVYLQEQLTLAQAVYLYWVPKVWEIQIVVGYYEDPNEPFAGSNSFTFGFENSSEQDFVCNPLFGAVSAGVGGGLANPPWNEKYFSLFAGNISGFKKFKFSNSSATRPENTLYSPYVDGYFSAYNEAGDDAVYIGRSIDSTGYNATGTASVTVGQFQVSIPYQIKSLTPAYTSGYMNYQAGVFISVAEYWSYGGTYDTATGLPL